MTVSVLVTRAAAQAAALEAALRQEGLDPVLVPAIEVALDPPAGDLDAAAGRLHTYAWVVVTSPNGARAILEAAERVLTELGIPAWAAIGSATGAVLEREGIPVRFEPTPSTVAAMAAQLPVGPGERVLVARGDLAGDRLALALRARGAIVDDVIAYRTLVGPDSSRRLLRRAIAAGPPSAVVFTSGSTVRGLLALGRQESIDVRSIPAVCIGSETADDARAAGFRVLAVSPRADAAELAAVTARALDRQPQEVS